MVTKSSLLTEKLKQKSSELLQNPIGKALDYACRDFVSAFAA